jgi:N-methylhydantoinase A
VIVPRFPGHLSALGQLLADRRHDAVRAWGGRLSALDPADLKTEAAALRRDAAVVLEADGFGPDRQSHSFTIDMRYAGQSFTLAVPLDDPVDSGAPDWDTLRSAFAQRHTQTFGHADLNNECEIVNIRLVSLGIVDKPALAFTSDIPANSDPILEHRKAWFGTGWTDCPIYDRAKMPGGLTITGPAIIEESGGTSVVPPDWKVTVHDSGTLICRNPVAG